MKENAEQNQVNSPRQRTKQRGRKPGDGVLKVINPQGSTLEKAIKLTYGRTHGDAISEMIRWYHAMPSMFQDLKEREKSLGRRLIDAAEHFQVSDEQLASGREFGGPDERRFIDALHYWKDKRLVESRTAAIRDRLHQQMADALSKFQPDWFQKMADAIKTENAASDQDAYPLHIALLSIAGGPEIRRTDVVYPERNDLAAVQADQVPRLTISELCKLMEEKGHRPTGQTDESWSATVRRAWCELGFDVVPSKPGPKES